MLLEINLLNLMILMKNFNPNSSKYYDSPDISKAEKLHLLYIKSKGNEII